MSPNNQPFSSCRSGLTFVALENADCLHKLGGLVRAAPQLPQDLPYFELGERSFAAAA